MAEQKEYNSEEIIKKVIEICEEHKAADIKVFDVREKTVLADYYVICSGTSLPHLRALADYIRRVLLDEGVAPRGRDGNPSSQWLVLDYGVIIVHIMTPDVRRFYGLETLWDKTKLTYQGGVPLPAEKAVPDARTMPVIPADIDEGYPIDERFLDLGEDDDQ